MTTVAKLTTVTRRSVGGSSTTTHIGVICNHPSDLQLGISKDGKTIFVNAEGIVLLKVTNADNIIIFDNREGRLNLVA